MFHTDTYATALNKLLQNSKSNVLIVYGDQDEFTGSGCYDHWVKELEGVAKGKGTLNSSRVENATHFWRGRASKELAYVVEGWLP
jgi:alpha/beta superfamily hydrolase